ncbi:CorA metal ion transporter [Friedmanniomyces endolithicus]|nr:CorA metal ion transporter [Friedmanniomyces endolithicus]KAK0880676.1 CorA metal ion transporter [Friedmanniomyces endolithicus]KAK0907239.1 CorA metal ion transporter [Friedmanniomyces endolithicus]KAK0913748.1 CorA metal ion transporter [Friedmanniomyces endolithicus]KAK0994082.1 CorA metal ion transporter [Friedmanniomyces endolithicus]
MARPYPSHYGRSRDGFPQRPSVASEPPFSHSRRSWTDNGVHYTVETGTFASPGLSFSAASGSASGLFGAFAGSESRNSRHAFGGGLLGTAVDLLGVVSGLHQAIDSRSLHSADRECSARWNDFDEQPESEDDTVYGDEAGFTGTRPRSMFSRFKDKLDENRQRARGSPYSPGTLPTQGRRQSSYRTEARFPAADPYFNVEGMEHQGYNKRHHDTGTRRTDPSAGDTLSALRRDVEHYRAQVKSSRKALERASRQRSVDMRSLQTLLNEVKMLERALATAEQDLREEENGAKRADHQERRQYHQHTCQHHRAPPTPPDYNDEEFPAAGLGYGPVHIHQACPLFAGFDEFHGQDPFDHAMFGAFDSPFSVFGGSYLFNANFSRLFGMPSQPQYNAPRGKRPRFSSANSAPRSQANPGFAAFTPAPPPAPPRTCLLPDEAKRLFKMYNDRWNALSPIDPNIPYPARGLQASALLDRRSIWAPMVNSPPTTWSEESVMQANAQAFYLGVVDMKPQYSEAAGKVSMGYDGTGATPAQVKQLVDLLKKEKTRWHSDRLGRRNRGLPGPNEGLQNDPRARAVFHAVCELMESVQ